MIEKNSRRVKMTKRLIQEALMELLQDKPLAKVTVTDICKTADVNRSTFYANYVDVEQLLREIEDEVITHIPVSPSFPAVKLDMRFLDMLEHFFEYVKENKKLFKVLIVEANNSKFNERLVAAAMERYHIKVDEADPIMSRYKYIYRISGVVGLMKEWINADFPVDSRSFARLVFRMTTHEVRID